MFSALCDLSDRLWAERESLPRWRFVKRWLLLRRADWCVDQAFAALHREGL